MKAKPKKRKKPTAEIREEFMGGKLRYKPKQTLPGDLKRKSEVKNILSLIDRELNNHDTLTELDFKAGYIAGIIHEKEANRLITSSYKDELISVLYAKYEIMRTLEEGEKECYL